MDGVDDAVRTIVAGQRAAPRRIYDPTAPPQQAPTRTAAVRRSADVRPPPPDRPAPRDGGGLAHGLRGDDPHARPGGRRYGRPAPLRRRAGHHRAVRTVLPAPLRAGDRPPRLLVLPPP